MWFWEEISAALLTLPSWHPPWNLLPNGHNFALTAVEAAIAVTTLKGRSTGGHFCSRILTSGHAANRIHFWCPPSGLQDPETVYCPPCAVTGLGYSPTQHMHNSSHDRAGQHKAHPIPCRDRARTLVLSTILLDQQCRRKQARSVHQAQLPHIVAGPQLDWQPP